MATIEVDFDVYKALTNRRATEAMSYNTVVRQLLKLPLAPVVEADAVSATNKKAWTWKGTTLPHGTQLRAEYKGQAYSAEIVDGHWMQNGGTYSSPSAAAFAITDTGINGWWFWSAKKPGSASFVALGTLRRESGT